MKQISLFSGIGGFELAGEWAGWENIASCEINPFGNQVLTHYWPEAYHHDNVKTLTYEKLNEELIQRFGTDWRNDDLIITGGFPCQPYSAAGKRLGKEDDRHLWPEMLRIIREVKPEWVVGENVLGLTNWNDGVVFNEVQTDLESAGYEVLPFVLPACSVNAPHRRDRVWFVAHSISRGRHERSKSEYNNVGKRSLCKNEQSNRNKVWSETSGCNSNRITTNTGLFGQKIGQQQSMGVEQLCKERSFTNAKSKQGERLQSEQREFSEQEQGQFRGISSEMGGRFITKSMCNGQPGQEHRKEKPGRIAEKSVPDYWRNFPTQSLVRSRNDGVSPGLAGITVPKHRNESIKAYGNAIVPQVVYQIFKAINQYLKNQFKMNKSYLGRTVTNQIEFNEPGTFMSYHAACKWCSDNGYSYGSMDGDNPIAIWKGECSISKWYNLSKEEKGSCDAVMVGDMRDGPVSIYIF